MSFILRILQSETKLMGFGKKQKKETAVELKKNEGRWRAVWTNL